MLFKSIYDSCEDRFCSVNGVVHVASGGLDQHAVLHSEIEGIGREAPSDRQRIVPITVTERETTEPCGHAAFTPEGGRHLHEVSNARSPIQPFALTRASRKWIL